MSKIIVREFPPKQEYILLRELDEHKNKSIFFGKDGKLKGSVVSSKGQYWLQTSVTNILGGGFNTLAGAILYGIESGYTFYLDVEV